MKRKRASRDALFNLELVEGLVGLLALGDLQDVEANGLGEGAALTNGHDVTTTENGQCQYQGRQRLGKPLPHQLPRPQKKGTWRHAQDGCEPIISMNPFLFYEQGRKRDISKKEK